MDKRNVEVITDLNGEKIVVIHDPQFRAKKASDWDAVEDYLWHFVGENFEIDEYAEKVYVGSVYPDEFAHSNDTKSLHGAVAKAKANSAVGLPELIMTATNKRTTPNYKAKHAKSAKNGWYRYDTRFAIPVYENGELTRYNVYKIVMIVNHAANGKRYLYDMINIRKETSKPPKE